MEANGLLSSSSYEGQEMKAAEGATMKKRELIHLFVTVFLNSFSTILIFQAITDVTIAAVCPGKDSCSLAIYLTGFQQAMIGMGTVVMNPVIGNLSDLYGRKALLTLPLTLSIIPLDSLVKGERIVRYVLNARLREFQQHQDASLYTTSS